MDQDGILRYLAETFAGVDVVRPTDGPGAGDTFFFWDPERTIDPARRLPFATLVRKDYAGFDSASNLDRPGIFRLNIGVSRETFVAQFGFSPSELEEKASAYDFAALDRLMPHPSYGRQSWVCVLNPSAETFESLRPLLAEAYAIAADRYGGRQTR